MKQKHVNTTAFSACMKFPLQALGWEMHFELAVFSSPKDFYLCSSREMASDTLCSWGCFEAFGVLWTIFQHTLSSAKNGWVHLLPFFATFQCISYMMFFWIFTLLFILWCVPDLIAIPDFQSGAMENWGLTTYRETSLLYDPAISSASDKLWVTLVIGHELAHQVIYKIHSHLLLAKPMNYRRIVLLNV